MDTHRLITLLAELSRLSQSLTNLESRMRSWSVSLRILTLDVETLRGVVQDLLRIESERGHLVRFPRSEIPANANRRDFPKEPGPPTNAA